MEKPKESKIDRREFLGCTAGALSLASSTQAIQTQEPVEPKTPSRDFGVGFIGVGRRGLVLVRTMKQIPGIRISALCDLLGDTLNEARKLYPDVFFTPQLGKVVLNSQAIVVALPHHLHRPVCLLALSYDRDVYLESPVTHKLDEAEELQAAAAAKPSRIVQTGFQATSHPINSKVKELIESGEIGEIRLIQGDALFNSKERAGYTGVPKRFTLEDRRWQWFLGEGPPTKYNAGRFLQWRLYKDYSTGLAGSEMAPKIAAIHAVTDQIAPSHVSAHGSVLHWKEPRENPDHLAATLEYPGFQVNLSVASSVTGSSPFLIIRGTKGFIEYEPNSCRLYRDLKEPVEFQSAGDPTRLHLEAFLQSVADRTRPSADLAFGLGVANTVHLINLADQTGKKIGWDKVSGKPVV